MQSSQNPATGTILNQYKIPNSSNTELTCVFLLFK